MKGAALFNATAGSLATVLALMVLPVAREDLEAKRRRSNRRRLAERARREGEQRARTKAQLKREGQSKRRYRQRKDPRTITRLREPKGR